MRFVPGRLWTWCALAALATGCATTQAPARVGLDGTHVEPELVLVRHTVQKGQTLFRIARAYGLSVAELAEANHLDDPRELRVGEELFIPGATELKPVPDFDAPEPEPRGHPEGSPRPSGPKSGVPERRAQTKAVKVGRAEGVLAWPLRGVLYAKFGRKGNDPHDGIDLSAPAGAPVKAAAPGSVLYAGEQKGYGLIVIVEHANALITLYAHNRDLRVKTGQKVRDGQVVATVGDSGRTSGPHLHFEVRKDGQPVDPLDYLGPVPPATKDEPAKAPTSG